MAYLHRSWYRTDIDDAEPEVVGMFSAEIPDRALQDRTIVGVDWSKRGEVEVTWLVSGQSPVRPL